MSGVSSFCLIPVERAPAIGVITAVHTDFRTEIYPRRAGIHKSNRKGAYELACVAPDLR